MFHIMQYIKRAAIAFALAAGIVACDTTTTSPVTNDAASGAIVTTNLPVPSVDMAAVPADTASGSTTAMRLSAAVTANSSQFMGTGWQEPLRTNTLGSTKSSWLASGCNGSRAYEAGLYHIGQDIPTAVGTAVFPVSAGTVVLVSPNDWGTGNVAVVVRHPIAPTGSILVLYGHIRSNLSVGTPVTPLTMLGTVGDYPQGSHLHVGVHGDTPLSGALGRLPCNPAQPTNGFVNPSAFFANTLPAVRADLAALDAQAVRDILAKARPDYRFSTPSNITVAANLNWDSNWQLRWATLPFTGNRRVTVYQATNVWDATVRFVAFYDPDRGNAWTGWARIY